jgi:hypothetical protein
MTGQPDLFESARYPTTPGHRNVDTSIAAAEAVKHKVPTIKKGVLDCLKANPDGLTADECAVKIGRHWQNVRPRCSELQEEGKICDSGRRRPNSSLKDAIVWVLR